ncbi:unnamed protein product [Rotaria sp. Silwood2]|nr:unnamed protein product [Rotaria sp. Silwood2]CAF2903295.1 unnamed protein product [Rotaria sp. Silwood2]CAF3299725.1 unnamed protein product [Rotaria sp. Silwood2]
MITNESQFFALRQTLSNQPTAKQTQLARSVAAVNVTQNTQHAPQRNTQLMEASIKRNNDKFKNNLFVHVTHEARLKGLAREIHLIHDSHFKNTIHGDIRLVVGYRNNPNIEFELSRKRPSSSILKDPLSEATSSDPTLLLPDYLTISDSKFKEMLLTSTSNNINTDALIELLNQKEILLFIRQLTQLVNKLNYSQLQNEQWSYYYNLGMTEGIWNGRVSKKMADANSMYYTYAKIIWKAIHDQQTIIHEILIFKKWLELHLSTSSCELQHLHLPNINRIFTSLAFQDDTLSTENMAQQTKVRAEEIVQTYTKIATTEKNKLLSTRTHHKNVQLLDQIITTILTRENNMIQRRVCELQRKLTMIFNETALEPSKDQLNIQIN